MKYLISIVIPHFDSLQELKVLLESIPEDERVQVIIVDDNSYDNEYYLIDAINLLKRKNVEIYFNSQKRGAGSCRNEGLKYIKGKWTVFADADDYFMKNAFEIMLSHVDSDADIIFFKPISKNLPIGELGTRHIPYATFVQSYIEEPTNERGLILKAGFVVPWSKMINSKLILDNSYKFDEVRWSNDVMFSTKCAFAANEIEVYDEIIYCVTRDSGSLTTQRNLEEYRTRFEVYVKKYKYLQDILSESELRLVTNAPIGKVLKAFYNGYGIGMIKYILKRYEEEKIPIFQFRKNTIRNLWMDLKKAKSDKNYLVKGDKPNGRIV